MIEFRGALDFCGFRDLGFVGAPFTWCNNQFDGVVTWIRLDRGVATPHGCRGSLRCGFTTSRVRYLTAALCGYALMTKMSVSIKVANLSASK